MQTVLFRFGGLLRADMILVLTLCFFGFGCGKCPKTGGDFVGKYEMIRPQGKVFLEVVAGGI